MSATYSINVGQPTESSKKQDINAVLQGLPDNTSKLISPRDVRDAILSSWANSAFKQTIGTASIEYIGIDSGDPSGRDIKEKILIGKRSVSGVDVMSSSLLNDPNVDIYLFNTKEDSSLTQSTRIAILAGTDSTLYTQAPYIESSVVDGVTQLDFINPSGVTGAGGPINLFSQYGRISVNNITFPSVDESSASASNGRILKYKGVYPDGILAWDDPNVTLASIGSTGSPTNIYGYPVLINGYPLELVDATPVPVTVGGVEQGTTFSAGATASQLVEVIRSILYPYVPPDLTLQVLNSVTNTPYAEVSTVPSIVLSYSMMRLSNDITTTSISGTTFSGASFSGDPGDLTQSSIVSATGSTSPVTIDYSLIVFDDASATSSATASFEFVYPVLYGFSTYSIGNTSSIVASMSKSITPYPGLSGSLILSYQGSGYLYFIMPDSYGTMSYIYDPNGYIIHDYGDTASSAFTYVVGTISILSSDSITYSSIYQMWSTILPCYVTSPSDFEFIF